MAEVRWGMRRDARVMVVLALLGAGRCFAEQQVPALPPVIPLPAEVTPGEGAFVFGDATIFASPAGDPDAQQVADYLVALMSRTHPGVHADRADYGRGATISFERRPGFAPEGYQIEVKSGGVRITASS